MMKEVLFYIKELLASNLYDPEPDPFSSSFAVVLASTPSRHLLYDATVCLQSPAFYRNLVSIDWLLGAV